MDLVGIDERAELTLQDPRRWDRRYGVPDSIELDFGPGDDQSDPTYPRLVWRIEEVRWSPALSRCLDGFWRLADAQPLEILAFARTWGVLGICDHWKPRNHGGQRCDYLGLGGETYWEPVEAWYRYARQVRAILSVACDLLDGRQSRSEDWATIEAAEPTIQQMREGMPGNLPSIRRRRPSLTVEYWAPSPGSPVEHQRAELGGALDHWLTYAAVSARVRWWPAPTLVTTLEYRGLVGALGTQLAAAVTSPSGLLRCDACSAPFSPDRRPRRGRRRYCAQCRESGAATLLTKRLWWHENRATKSASMGTHLVKG